MLVISDPEEEVGFDVLCQYCGQVAGVVGNDCLVLPMWPHGKVELIDNTNEIETVITNLKSILEQYEELFNGGTKIENENSEN